MDPTPLHTMARILQLLSDQMDTLNENIHFIIRMLTPNRQQVEIEEPVSSNTSNSAPDEQDATISSSSNTPQQIVQNTTLTCEETMPNSPELCALQPSIGIFEPNGPDIIHRRLPPRLIPSPTSPISATPTTETSSPDFTDDTLFDNLPIGPDNWINNRPPQRRIGNSSATNSQLDRARPRPVNRENNRPPQPSTIPSQQTEEIPFTLNWISVPTPEIRPREQCRGPARGERPSQADFDANNSPRRFRMQDFRSERNLRYRRPPPYDQVIPNEAPSTSPPPPYEEVQTSNRQSSKTPPPPYTE